MFWKIIFALYLASTILYLVLAFSAARQGVRIFKERHPYVKNIRSTPNEGFIGVLRACILAAIPILNFICMMIFVFDYDKAVESVLKMCEDKLEKGEFYE